MTTEHFDIGTIQAFLDGELTQERIGEVSAHIALCDDCALMLAEAEDESAIVFPAIEREFNVLVPTQRLWSKINDSIAIEKENTPLLQKVWAFLAGSLLNPSLAAAAGLLIVAGLVAILWMGRTTAPTDDVAAIPKAKPATSAVTADPAPVPVPKTGDGDIVTNELKTGSRIERAAYRPEPRRSFPVAAVPADATANMDPLPGEESYIRTIETLSRSVDGQKDTTMRPSERVAYERDMAVVNDSISKMRDAVKKNPRNESAKQVLYTSYQNKIDLLNSVSQKEELMASLDR